MTNEEQSGGSWSDDAGTESHPVGGDDARDPSETGYDRETEEIGGTTPDGAPPG